MSGKTIRLARIFKNDGKTVIVAIDHGQFQGPMEGIVNLPETIRDIVSGYPDALILNPGAIAKNSHLFAGKTSVIARITGASSTYSTTYDYHRLTTSVEHAMRLGADAVIVMGFIGGAGENLSLEIIGKIAEECDKLGMPLMVEMLPQNMEHFMDPKFIAAGSRAAYELGADILKVYYTGKDSFGTIISAAPIPVVIAGGPKGQDAFVMAKEGIELGAAGVAFGRNVFQAEERCAYVKKLLKVVHG